MGRDCQRTLLETRISLAKLRKLLFGKRTEKPRRKPRQPPEGEDESDPASDTEAPAVEAAAAGDGRQWHPDSGGKTGSGEQAPVGTELEKSPPRPGHGRLGAADYPGAEMLFCPHHALKAGRETYAVSLKVTLALAHYHLGLPFKRIESFQRLVGMPLPDAT